MGFLDKAKATATQAMQQGQAKVEAIQQSRAEAELYRTLGEATYNAQRRGGDQAAVNAAVEALDKHFASVAAPAAPGSAGAAGASGASAGGSTAGPTAPTSQSQAAPPSGNFTLDDM